MHIGVTLAKIEDVQYGLHQRNTASSPRQWPRRRPITVVLNASFYSLHRTYRVGPKYRHARDHLHPPFLFHASEGGAVGLENRRL